MHLKSLTLTGFKSFADRTRIDCEPGVTVVVGPNGSGKSNIVDAIAWVMGTQATTALRTQRMDDVIFAGTAVRPALGRAEVSLTLDNSSGRLALDLAEATITRRLFRDGTSEYEINGTPCRLLDIQELLADSGVGRHQHVVVGQGRIDDVLAAGPDDHRAVIEEAAGVIKHRRRRERALRRLEATDLDLERARDLLEEERRRVRPLKRQANAAERHDGLKAEWRSLRLWLGGEQLRSVRIRHVAATDAREVAKRRLDEAIGERDAIAAALIEMQAEAGEAGEALERDRAAAARLEPAAERLQSLALVARERRLGLERSERGERERRRDLEAEQATVEGQLSVAADEERSAVADAEASAVALRALEDEERSLAEADRLPTEGLAASFRGDLAALEAAAARDERERLELTRRRGAVAALAEQEESEEGRLAAEAEVARLTCDAAVGRLEELRGRAANDAATAAAAEERWRLAETTAAAARARVEAMEAARARLVDGGARATAASLDSVVGTVVERLDVPPELGRAVAAALGPWAEAFAAADPDGVMAAARHLKAAGEGGAAFVSRIPGSPVIAREAAAATDARAVVDLLGPAADADLAATLLGDVVLVEDWVAAQSIVSAHRPARAVTLAGDLITATGIAVADADAAAAEAVAAARAVLERCVTDVARSRSHRATARRAADASADAERVAAGAVLDAERKLGGVTEAIRLLERSRGEHRAEMDRLDGRLRALAEAAATRAERIAELRARIAGFEGDDGGNEAAWEEISRRRIEVAARREAAASQREAAAATAAAAAERRALLERRRDDLATRIAEDDAGPDGAPVAVLAAVESWARRAGEAVRRHVGVLRERERTLRSEVGSADGRVEAAREGRERLLEKIEAIREEASALAVESTELRVREESIAEALRRDVDASEEEALAADRPALPDGAEPEAHLESLAASLRRMGPINPLAAAEYREVSERVAFMEEQLADLERSRADLRKVIRALDEEIARLFMEAFEDIAATFAETFGRLFPGGTGRLTLTESDPLVSGVEIHAQPMGKKVGRLTLLSGGERSLAALAFLFAVFRSRPSPFYVLDEVEAALDDANLRRFLRLVSTLRDEAQLLIVTHQQQTMEVADLLYGVTMEPGETSRVLAKRLVVV